MKGSLRQSMAWLHTWSGLLVGWVLFAVFLTGTTAYFNEEISQWMRPELHRPADPDRAIAQAIAYLDERAPEAADWYITPPGPRSNATPLFWRPDPAGGSGSATLDGAGEPVQVRDTQGGFFLYRFHFDLHYLPVIWARYIVGFAAMFMLVAILSGVITHKKIFQDFFTLRLKKGQRSWLDGHNVCAVLALPFHLMITYTGLVTLMFLYMPFGIGANFADEDRFYDRLYPQADVAASGERVPLAPIGPMLAQVRAAWGDAPIGRVTITNPGDRTAQVEFGSGGSDRLAARGVTMIFDGATGTLRTERGAASAAILTQQVMIGLHAGRFAGPVLRWLYFLSGVAGTVMVGTGLVLWTVKRRQKLPDPARPPFGFRLVERLNIGTIAGLPAGVAAYFLANRLLPLDLVGRDAWEADAMFVTWGLVFLVCLFPATRRAWPLGLGIAAALFAAVPVVNALTTGRHLPGSLVAGDPVFAAFDLAMLVTAAVLGFAAVRAGRHRPVAKPVTRRQTTARQAA